MAAAAEYILSSVLWKFVALYQKNWGGIKSENSRLFPAADSIQPAMPQASLFSFPVCSDVSASPAGCPTTESAEHVKSDS